MVRLLVEMGADVNMFNEKGLRTPLVVAEQLRHTQIVNFLKSAVNLLWTWTATKNSIIFIALILRNLM